MTASTGHRLTRGGYRRIGFALDRVSAFLPPIKEDEPAEVAAHRAGALHNRVIDPRTRPQPLVAAGNSPQPGGAEVARLRPVGCFFFPSAETGVGKTEVARPGLAGILCWSGEVRWCEIRYVGVSWKSNFRFDLSAGALQGTWGY